MRKNYSQVDPRGWSGQQCPLAARIFVTVDVCNALSFDRPSQKARPPSQVLDAPREQSGKHFVPTVVDEFLQLLEKIEPGDPKKNNPYEFH